MENIGARPRTKWTPDLGPAMSIGWVSLPGVHQAGRTSEAGCAARTRPNPINREATMDRAELQSQIDELMRQYQDGEIDGETYSRRMMELTTSAQE